MPDYIPFPNNNTGPSKTIPAGTGNGFYAGQQIYVRTTGSNPAASPDELVKSSATQTLVSPLVPPTGSWGFTPSDVAATLTVGDTLDADWNATIGEPSTSQTYLWERSDDGSTGWSSIGTNATYTLVSADEAKFVRVTGTAFSADGGSVTDTQTWTSAVQAGSTTKSGIYSSLWNASQSQYGTVTGISGDLIVDIPAGLTSSKFYTAGQSAAGGARLRRPAGWQPGDYEPTANQSQISFTIDDLQGNPGSVTGPYLATWDGTTANSGEVWVFKYDGGSTFGPPIPTPTPANNTPYELTITLVVP